MAAKEVKNGIYWVGANHPERKFFDELFPLPEGTSYNSYLVRGTGKTALIDTVDPVKAEELVANLRELNIEKLDYVVSNHAEQDHSGSIPKILELYPEAKVVTNAKCKPMLMDLLDLKDENFLVVGENDALDLGGKTLRFILAPWVHWPETMFTYVPEEKILFTCDFLGSHESFGDSYDEDDGKRYFAEIMLPYRAFFRNHLEKVAAMDLEMIAPSHGPLIREPAKIIGLHREWASEKVKNKTLIVYVSMHGSTEKMVRHLESSLAKKGVEAKTFDVAKTGFEGVSPELLDSATVVFASPVVLNEAHPALLFAVHAINILKPKTKFYSIIGSFGWAATHAEQIKGAL
ncbi:MAG: FprA family A-type flavoprotein, partial [Candidatus ainarchaeum sp.]|nr:FprA family A-type flavoprotein [Candidatus ainarchaeum sp.]